MPYSDLRAFLKRLETEGEIIGINRVVSTEYEVGAICRKALLDGSIDNNKALLFKRPHGYDIPIAANIVDSTRRYFMALDLPVDIARERFQEIWEERTSKPIQPKIVSDGPCKENIIKGDDVDIMKFPIPIWNEKDGGRFITMPCVISRDFATGKYNAGIYRSQVFDRNTLGVLAAPYRHLVLGGRSLKEGENLPVAFAIGLDPTLYIAAGAPFGYGIDEIEMAGSLRGTPVDLVECETIPLAVPATSEIVIEGEMELGKTRLEGPFGEFTGYYGEAGLRPFIKVKAITHRNSPIYQACYEGRPPICDSVLQILAHEAEMKRKLQPEHKPFVKYIAMPFQASTLLAVASIRKQFDGQAPVIGQAILSAYPSARWVKILILVDEDINPHDLGEVMWAVSTRCNFDQDLNIIRNVTGTILDPSMPLREKESKRSRHTKIMIDATKPIRNDPEKPIPEECKPKKEIWARIEEIWNECVSSADPPLRQSSKKN